MSEIHRTPEPVIKEMLGNPESRQEPQEWKESDGSVSPKEIGDFVEVDIYDPNCRPPVVHETSSDLDSEVKKDILESKAERLNIAEPSTEGGGSYKEVKKYVAKNEIPNQEVHHMPAKSVSELHEDDGPSIAMDKKDHERTASCGNTREAKEYREAQKELIDEGKFREALQMDIDDIHEKFGDKYDAQIEEMLEYVDKLEEAGVI